MADGSPLVVLHVTATLSRRGGGVARCVREAAARSAARGVRTIVATLDDAWTAVDAAPLSSAGVEVVVCHAMGPRSAGFSPVLPFAIDRLPRVDVIHTHGLRTLVTRDARIAANKRNVPLIISPHGQLDPAVLARHPLRKAVLNAWYENANLRAAAAIHATCDLEAEHARAAGIRRPIEVIPLGIDAPPAVAIDAARLAVERRFPLLAGKRRLLFLSTIYRKKNLFGLARIWPALAARFPGWRLVIAGVELDDERSRAQRELIARGAAGSAVFVGEVDDDARRDLLTGCDLFVLPTLGENFALSVADALAAGLPVITTTQTPWREIEQRGCGWCVPASDTALGDALTRAMSLDEDARRTMSGLARAWACATFNWDTTTDRLIALYRRLATTP